MKSIASIKGQGSKQTKHSGNPSDCERRSIDTMVDVVERLNALLKQVRTAYVVQDYLDPDIQSNMQRAKHEVVATNPVSSCCSEASSSSVGITEVWREKICEWSYQVVDHFEFSREVVSVSISLLDRFLCTEQVDKKQFQLAAMTTLYLAIKLTETGKLSMRSMIQLSRGFFTIEQMAAMEMTILRSLSWRVHPPTTFCFARHFLSLLHVNAVVDSSILQDVLELTRFLTELSVIDYFFATKCASSVAVAALLNSMEVLNLGLLIPKCADKLKILDDFDPFSNEVVECRSRLHELFVQGDYSRSHIVAAAPTNVGRTDTVSPICVGDFGSAAARNGMPNVESFE